VIDCVKGHQYPLDEFLFGLKTQKENKNLARKLVESAERRGNQLLHMVIYLAPSDYHRFHSAAHFTAQYRRHVAGYLEPVKPAYVNKHKDVFKDNERATLFGEWAYGFFGMTMVGALNVGSIVVNFDEELKTNTWESENAYIRDKAYTTQVQMEHSKKRRLGDPALKKYLDATFTDFGARLSDKQVQSKIQEFQSSTRAESQEMGGEQLGTEGEGDQYQTSEKGIALQKGQEVGMFRMGSTVVLLFECPLDYQINCEPGQKLSLGEEIACP